MKKLLVYLKDYKKESVLAPLFKMLEASFELIVPLVVTAIIDVGIADRNSGYILKMCLVMVALGLIGLVCSVTAQYFAAKAAAGFGTRVLKNAFQIAEMIFQTHSKLQISVFCTKSNPFSVYTTGYMLSMALQGKTMPEIYSAPILLRKNLPSF